MARNASIIVHTHWDREWYLTNEEYTGRLLRIFPSILESLKAGQLDHFLFDGQTAALEDLLEHCEESVARAVIAHIKEGRIHIGPWYVMPDEFLCSGEALVRNLEEGIRVSRHYGESAFVGYLPDSFGHVAQMPQILKGFHIDAAVVWRGAAAESDLFRWRSPNGDELRCIFLPEGYYQNPFSKMEYVEAAARYFDALAGKASRGPLLLTEGGDHLAPPENLKDRISKFNAAQNKYHLKQTTLHEHAMEKCADDSRPLPVLAGELRDNSNAFVLPDVLSSRRYLKRLNQEAEDRLLGRTEPLLAAVGLGGRYPRRYLRETWKLLLQQHAHDSICGCSIDEVHREMVVRFRRVQNRLDAMETLACEAIGLQGSRLNRPGAPSPFADDARMTAFNPSLKSRSGWHPVDLFLQGEKAAGLEVEDQSGGPCEAIVCGCEEHRSFASPVDDFPQHSAGHRYEVFVRLSMEGWESKALRFAKKPASGESSETAPSGGSQAQTEISNDWLSVSLSERGIRIENIRSGEAVDSALSVISEGDAGDSYSYSPPPEPWISEARIVSARRRQFGPHGAELAVSFRLRQPQSLCAGRSGASTGQVDSHGLLRMRLFSGEPFVRAALEWTNKAKDHRLRLVFPLGGKAAGTASDSAFALIRRPVAYREEPKALSKPEARVSVNPSYSFIEAGKLSIGHLAMQEYEVLDRGETDALALTLIRCVGWLSRRDLLARSAGAGPDFETPEAQCIGTEEFRFIFSVGGAAGDRVSLQDAEAFRRPALFLNGAGEVAARPLKMRSEALLLSSCRQLDGELEIRLFNPTAKPQEYELSGGSARRVSLAGEDIENPSDAVAPGEIATLRIKR
ncbi:MAG: glycoside hydrolase family 38 [Gammaproteobacteria bacterium]|nr:glycoside hydrolase family 38 [Gammaproteobacteria bacterium]MCY4165681.1 glycoside hydrolase family 38 [Gammaproteobacteria bacterium]